MGRPSQKRWGGEAGGGPGAAEHCTSGGLRGHKEFVHFPPILKTVVTQVNFQRLSDLISGPSEGEPQLER